MPLEAIQYKAAGTSPVIYFSGVHTQEDLKYCSKMKARSHQGFIGITSKTIASLKLCLAHGTGQFAWQPARQFNQLHKVSDKVLKILKQSHKRKECLVVEVCTVEPGFHSHSFWVTLTRLFDRLSNEANTFKGHDFCVVANINTYISAQVLQ